MITVLAELVDGDALLKVVVGSLGAGVGVTAIFSVAILGATRFADMRRDRRSAGAAAFGVVTVLALAGCVAALVAGLLLMTSK